MQFALFVTGCLWLLAAQSAAARSAQGIASRLNLAALDAPLEQAFFIFLLLAGFAILDWIATRSSGIRTTNSLPSRSTSSQEFSRGIALGWGIVLAAGLIFMLAGDLHPSFSFAPRSIAAALVSILTLALGTLALEVAFRGYLFTRLIAAVGPTAATILLSLLYAIFPIFHPYFSSVSFVVTFLTGIVFSLAYLRTHGLWFGWGLHFAWSAVAAVLLGLPVAGYTTFNSVVQTDVYGSYWFAGGYYGLEASLVAAAVVLASVPLVYRITRDYHWNYTYVPIVPAAYAAVVAPPAEHTAMEAAVAAVPAPLVQILGTTSTNASTLPVIDEHLRKGSDSE